MACNLTFAWIIRRKTIWRVAIGNWKVAVDDLMKQLGAPRRNIASKEQK
jgi:hypothetical protein